MKSFDSKTILRFLEIVRIIWKCLNSIKIFGIPRTSWKFIKIRRLLVRVKVSGLKSLWWSFVQLFGKYMLSFLTTVHIRSWRFFIVRRQILKKCRTRLNCEAPPSWMPKPGYVTAKGRAVRTPAKFKDYEFWKWYEVSILQQSASFSHIFLKTTSYLFLFFASSEKIIFCCFDKKNVPRSLWKARLRSDFTLCGRRGCLRSAQKAVS